MPVLIAVGVATIIVAIVLGLAARSGRTGDAADVRADGGAVTGTAIRHSRLRRFIVTRRDTTKATGLVLTIALAATAMAILIVGLVLDMVHEHQGFARWDKSAARWGAENSTHSSRMILRSITQLGATYVVITVAIVVSILEYRRLPTRAVPGFLAAVVGSELLINNVIKWIVGRERPDLSQFAVAHGSSFPSGHTAAAAATYAAVALLVGRRRRRRTRAALAGAAGAVTAAVAASRVLLGVHWVTDVIAGAFVGWACFALCSIAFGGRLLHFGTPLEAARAQLGGPAGTPPGERGAARDAVIDQPCSS